MFCNCVEWDVWHLFGSHWCFCIYYINIYININCCTLHSEPSLHACGFPPSPNAFCFLCELAGGFILAFALWKPTVVICKSCGLEIKITVHVHPLSCFLAYASGNTRDQSLVHKSAHGERHRHNHQVGTRMTPTSSRQKKKKKTLSYAFNVNINSICKWEKSILQSAFFDVTRGRGCRRNSQVAASGFHLLPFQAYDDDPVPFGEPDHLAQFAWNILCCVDFSFSIIFYCIYRWLELTTQWSHWLAFRTALRHKDEPDSIMLRIK